MIVLPRVPMPIPDSSTPTYVSAAAVWSTPIRNVRRALSVWNLPSYKGLASAAHGHFLGTFVSLKPSGQRRKCGPALGPGPPRIEAERRQFQRLGLGHDTVRYGVVLTGQAEGTLCGQLGSPGTETPSQKGGPGNTSHGNQRSRGNNPSEKTCPFACQPYRSAVVPAKHGGEATGQPGPGY
ncbi:hypothetical protein VUR80DRAFT_7431 [Thermomyces stellatus]